MISFDPGPPAGSIQVAKPVGKSSPADADVFYLRGKAYAALGQNPEAIEALRRSMGRLISNGTLVDGHPSVWAPFVLVGKGGGP
jgi:hypothetical protein